jgi:hypothetical protein
LLDDQYELSEQPRMSEPLTVAELDAAADSRRDAVIKRAENARGRAEEAQRRVEAAERRARAVAGRGERRPSTP